MSKGRRSANARAYRQTGREANVFARRYSLPLFDMSAVVRPRRSTFLSEFEDRRTWHPEGIYRPARSFEAPRHRLKAVGVFSDGAVRRSERSRAFVGVPSGIGFEDARRVLVCVRRKTRKQVIHALGVAGRKGLRPPRFSEYSKISCKG